MNGLLSSKCFEWRGAICAHAPEPVAAYVYLLHFDEPYKHARHYLGCTGNLEQRLEAHGTGRGARLMEVVHEAGIRFVLARLWKFDTYEQARAWERKLKTWQAGPRLCPICKGRQVQAEIMIRYGHWPLHLFREGQGRRRPMSDQQRRAPFITR